MEEAASLFGPPDSASDPFGSIVTNGSHDHAASSTSPPSEHPLSETQKVDTGHGWFDGSSGHYQAEASLYPEYEWPNGDDAGGHYNTQPHYEGPTPSGFYQQSLDAHGGDNLQYTASHDAGHVYGTQQQYDPSATQSSFEQSSIPQSNDVSSGDPTSSALQSRAPHVQPTISDPYGPAMQLSSNSSSSSMYPKPVLSSPPYDRTATYSAYQPVTNNSHSVPQPGYQSYSARPSPLQQLGTTDKPPGPTRTTAPYRPKTSNAYDPPIPPRRPSRHVSSALGPPQVFPPTIASHTSVAQDARHVTHYTNPSQLPPPNRYTPQAQVSPPSVSTHPPSNPRLSTNVSPPRRESRSRIVPGSSAPREPSIGNSPYSAQLGSESNYPPRNTYDRTWPQHGPSIDAVVESTPSSQLGYPAAVSRGNEVPTSIQADSRQPGHRGELPARIHASDTSLSGNQYHHTETGGGFTQHPITNNYSPEVARSIPAPIHTNSHEASGYAPTQDRVHSPSNSSVHSTRSTKSRDLVSPPPSSVAAASAPVSMGPSTESLPVVSRGSSPASTQSWKSPRYPSHDPYAPGRNTESVSLTTRDRSMSNSSLVSSRSSVTSDLYIPSRLGQNLSEVPVSASLHQTSRVTVHDADRSQGQTLILPPQTHAPYAPSPSLLGSNDPLGRTSSRAPIVSFGFGGKLVLCFHGSNTLNTGFDIALSSRQTTGIQMRSLNAAIPESALDHISTSFPEPTSLVRAAVATQSKNNKAKVIKYLEGRAEEISRGLGYLSRESSEHRQAEGKLALVKLLKVLVEHDGHLSGSPQIDAAVRIVLVPRLGDVSGLEPSTSPKTAPYSFDSAATSSLSLPSLDTRDRVLSVHTVRASALDTIQGLLAKGDRRDAYRYALDEQLWAHAMVIASSIDKEAWKEVVNEFIRSELNTRGVTDSISPDATASGAGREPLKVAYSLYSGQGAASIQALVPPTSLLKIGEKTQPPVLSHITPTTANFTSHATPGPVPADILKKWPETAAMLIPGPSVTESSAALLALGDCLLANDFVEAAHACYLLAPQSAVLGNIGSPGRVPLVGSRGPTATPNFHVSEDAIVFSEIVEFALSLAPSKSQESFNGLSHFQAYKFIRAASLAEMGHMLAASRYCEAIAACMNRTQTVPHPELSEQIRELTYRLDGAPHLDKTGSWIRGKVTRPSLDSLGNWLGGRLTELVAGNDDSPTMDGDTTPHESKTFAGPFSHYSTITPSTTSKVPSPQPSTDHSTFADAQKKHPQRTGSAQALRHNPQVQIDRASSAMEYRPAYRNSSPGPRIASASAATTQFSQTNFNYGGYPYANEATNSSYQQSSDGDLRAGAWWGSSSTGNSSTTTPTVPLLPNDRLSPSSDFVSLMEVSPIPSISDSSITPRSSALATHEEDDDDLGLGNSSSKRKASLNDPGTQGSSIPDPKPAETDRRSRPDPKPNQQSSSWFTRWWSREGSSGPVKATLGEESSFVYDKELKRWVDKKSPANTAQPAAPPPLPPSRAQTTSPNYSATRKTNGVSLAPPPLRAASAVDLTASPPKRMVPRPRSALPPTGDEVPNGVPPPGPRMTDSPSPGPFGSPTPPPSRPRSQATKRNIRNRYVDVFHAET
ncbi:Sec23-binding domain of Sec16-domain-containing protein [Russula emetica]|nr:Sec23-binding domain of Sec16-domain-containing protein [Russula emetica]